MLQIRVPDRKKPEVVIIDLIDNFHQLDESSKKNRANQFALDLIELFNATKTLPLNGVQLNNQQVTNFLSLIFYMVYAESLINQQIQELEGRLTIQNPAHNYLGDISYNNFIQSFLNSYFVNKDHKIFSLSLDNNALYSSSGDQLILHHTIGNYRLGHMQAFEYLRYCQISRVIAIAVTLSTSFCQMSSNTYEILEDYEKEQASAKIWLSFTELMTKNILAQLCSGEAIGILWFHIALHYSDAALFFQWLSLGATIQELDHTSQKSALQLAINSGHKALLGKFLVAGFTPSEEELKNKNETILNFLEYKPGRNYISIRQFLHHEIRNPESLKLMIDDEANSSDEESSDDEIDDFLILNPMAPEGKQFLVRGVNYCPGYFTTQMRCEAKQIHFHRQSIQSRATRDLAASIPLKTDGSIDVEHADQLVKGFLELLKLTPDKPELNEQYKKKSRTLKGDTATFRTLYYRFIQAYVNSYQELFKENGGMTRNFNFYSNHNPVLSTTPDVVVACRYASGERINHSVKFFPKVRRSTGELKHRRLGYVEVFLIDNSYYQKHATNIDQLNREGEIGIVHNYSFNQEIIVESSIPAEYILGYQIFSLPRMNVGWSTSIQQQYGLNKMEYDNFRSRLCAEKSEPGIQQILEELIERVTETQAQQLLNRIGIAQQQIATPATQQPTTEGEVNTIAEAINKLTFN